MSAREHVHNPFSYLGNGWVGCAEIWFVVNDPFPRNFAQAKSAMYLHMCSCKASPFSRPLVPLSEHGVVLAGRCGRHGSPPDKCRARPSPSLPRFRACCARARSPPSPSVIPEIAGLGGRCGSGAAAAAADLGGGDGVSGGWSAGVGRRPSHPAGRRGPAGPRRRRSRPAVLWTWHVVRCGWGQPSTAVAPAAG